MSSTSSKSFKSINVDIKVNPKSEQIMSDFDNIELVDLLSDQAQDFESLKRQADTIKTLVANNKSASVLNQRAGYLRYMWKTCQDRNAGIYRIAKKEETRDIAYFKENHMAITETIVFDALDIIAEHFATLPPQLEHPANESQPALHQHSGVIDSSVRLARLDLSKFSGKPTEWQSFRDMFTSLVKNNRTYDNFVKMTYLRNSLSNDALDLICHLDITAASFDIAWDLLLKQYDNKIALTNAHLNALFALEPIKKESTICLRSLRSSVKRNLGALKNLGRNVDGYNDILINRIVALLDSQTKRDWELSLTGKTDFPLFDELDQFLVNRIQVLESINQPSQSNSTINHTVSRSKMQSNIIKSHLASTYSIKCIICNETHLITKCKIFKDSSEEERFSIVKKHKLCINCLKPNHMLNECKSTNTCSKCHKRHHTMLHRESHSNVKSTETITNASERSCSGMQVANTNTRLTTHCSWGKTVQHSQVLLATARVWVLTPTSNRAIRVRALIDQGSTWSFISRELASALNVNQRRVSASLDGVGTQSAVPVSYAAEIRISPTMHGEVSLETTALILPKLTSYVPNCKASVHSLPHLANLELSDNPSNNDPIHLLIGANLYGSIILDGLIKGSNTHEPIAQNTIFGWILCGNYTNTNTISTPIATHHCISNDALNELLKKFWEIENIPTKRILSIEDELCEAHFRQTHSRSSEGRYIARLPFKSQLPLNIGESRHIAESCLKRVESRLAKNDTHRTMYSEFMQEYESLNHMQLVSNDNSSNTSRPVYLPHHPVFRDSSQTTKLRVVFNASAKTTNNTSLNDHMYAGPALQADLPIILNNWRAYQFVYTADIAKMYRQILIDERDVDYQRILWRESIHTPIKDYQLLTVTYGTRSAPYLALRVLKQLVEDEGYAYPQAASIILNDTYVDDILSGAHTYNDAVAVRIELTSLLAKGKFEARKWMSNTSSLLVGIDSSNHGIAWIAPSDNNDGLKILGLHWNPITDSFSFKVSFELPSQVTKRSVLSLIARLFDPMGWISPITIIGKLFIQQLWRDQYTWDDPLPSPLAISISEYFNSLHDLVNLCIPRWTGFSLELQDAQLHGFSDASERAFGAAVYLRVVTASGDVVVSLLYSKTRVAPIKHLSIPRLELQAAVLLSRLVISTRESRSLSNLTFQCWTDAGIVLTWLSQHASKWKTYVANRVSEIHTMLPDHQWRHVPSDSNPADLLSRGKPVHELIASPLWWHGPPWLAASKRDWPSTFSYNFSSSELEEKGQVYTNHAHTHNLNLLSNLIQHCSTWKKLLRVTACIMIFIRNLKLKRDKQPKQPSIVTSLNITKAEIVIINQLQNLLFPDELNLLKNQRSLPKGSKLISLNPYLDSNGIIRVGGRLAHSELSISAKHPIVLAKHRITKLIIEHEHARCLHGGVRLTLCTIRQTYWILSPRQQVKSVIYKCVICAKARATLSTQIMANLPAQRVTRPPRAFSDCGVDYAGPLQVRMQGGKGHKSNPCYIVIFVCFAIKAIHLEVVTDNTTESFIAAFKRFTSRRGYPQRMYSDCGTNLRGADRALQLMFEHAYKSCEFKNLLAHDRIVWHFNPPAAPHFGGLWEAGVRSVKGHMKRILRDKTPTLVELMTLLCQIEAALNSRPLGSLTDHVDEYDVLTPGHFLVGGPLTEVPEPSLMELNPNRLARWQQMQQCFEIFWRRWSSDYLQSLQQRSKWFFERENVKTGQLVLLKQKNLPPTKWLIGRIEECIASRDNKVRTVKVKTAESKFLRPITEIAILPIDIESSKTCI